MQLSCSLTSADLSLTVQSWSTCQQRLFMWNQIQGNRRRGRKWGESRIKSYAQFKNQSIKVILHSTWLSAICNCLWSFKPMLQLWAYHSTELTDGPDTALAGGGEGQRSASPAGDDGGQSQDPQHFYSSASWTLSHELSLASERKPDNDTTKCFQGQNLNLEHLNRIWIRIFVLFWRKCWTFKHSISCKSRAPSFPYSDQL